MKAAKALLALILLLSGSLQLYPQNTKLVVLDGSFESSYLDEAVELYVDTAQSTIEEVLQNHSTLQPQEVSSAGHMINIGYNRDTWWLHWELINNTNKLQRLRILLGSGIINHAVLYIVQDSLGAAPIDSLPAVGIDHPYQSRYYDTRGWSYAIRLNPGQHVHYWLRLRNDLASLRVPLQIWEADAYHDKMLFFNMGWGIFFGILLLTILGALAVFVATRQAVFLYYSLYIASIILLCGSTLGFNIIILNVEGSYQAHTYVFVISVLVVVSMLMFSSVYLDFKSWAPKLIYIIYLTLAILLVMTVLWFFWPNNIEISQWLIHIFTFMPLVSLTIILIGVLLQKPIPHQHKLYLIAFSPLVILSIGIALRNIGILGHTILFDIRLPVSFAFEAVVFSYALAIRIRDMRNERETLLQQVNVQQRDSFRAVIEATEKERKRVAEELHDGLGQLLSTAKLNLTAIEITHENEEHGSINTSLSLLDEAVQEVRHISHNMMPGTLIRLGLVSAIKEQARKINESGKILVTVVVTGFESRMDESREIAMYRVIQEVMNNAIRYSGATDIEIKLEQLADGYLFLIKDNGKGFDPKLLEGSKGIGWRNIRSRVDLLQGNIDLKTAPGKGTLLSIWVP